MFVLSILCYSSAGVSVCSSLVLSTLLELGPILLTLIFKLLIVINFCFFLLKDHRKSKDPYMH